MKSALSVRWAFNFNLWHPTREEWLLAIQSIQSEERERVNQFVYRRDAKSALVGRLMQRKLLHTLVGIPYRDIQLGRTEKGKPYLINPLPADVPKTFSFNVSHHGDYTVLAAEPHHQIGVDVMKIERTSGKSVPEFFRLMNRQFTKEEWSCILTPNEETDQLAMFYRHWCLKESYLKALGLSIGFELRRLRFQLVNLKLDKVKVTQNTRLFLDGNYVDNFSFDELLLDDAHCVAVALTSENFQESSEQNSPRSQFTFLTIEDLLKEVEPLVEQNEEDWKSFETKDESPQLTK